VAVHLAGGGPDSKGKFLKDLQKGGPGKLQLQAIPLPVAEVKARPLLMADNVAVHVAASWPIKGLTFDGQAGLKGPVPVLFTTAPGELGERLAVEPDNFKLHLNKAMRG
jgi:hypothetical protein